MVREPLESPANLDIFTDHLCGYFQLEPDLAISLTAVLFGPQQSYAFDDRRVPWVVAIFRKTPPLEIFNYPEGPRGPFCSLIGRSGFFSVATTPLLSTRSSTPQRSAAKNPDT
jgi:hypothetical protein